jgi:hypothetical protein
MMAPTKNGGTKTMFPALNWAYLEGGHLWDVNEGVLMMEDANLSIINATQTKAGKVVLSNASPRWFAQRYSAGSAWIFHGYYRSLSANLVPHSGQVGAVALL